MKTLAQSSLPQWLVVTHAFAVACAFAGPVVASTPSYCPDTVVGGAAPPERLGAEQTAIVRKAVARYRVDALSPADARALLQELKDAGLRRDAALDRALAEAGLSARRLFELAPCPTPAGANGPRTGPRGRPIPPPE